MKIDIFDVGHGNCSLITCPNGARIMVDCGFKSDLGWFPSVAFAGQFIDLLVFNNLDEVRWDHLTNLFCATILRCFPLSPADTVLTRRISVVWGQNQKSP